jgi:hypothetical protein
MTFDEAQKQLNQLNEQYGQGRISPEQYQAAIGQLRFQDASGRWWQPQPGGEGWLVWDGSAWQSGVPAGMTYGMPSRPAELQTFPGAGSGQPAAAEGPGIVRQMAQRRAGQFVDPQTFFELSRRLPMAQRPQSWWNLLSVLGGAVSGYAWFVYGSVRGMPRLKFLGVQRESWLDLLPTLVLLALPIVAIIFRRALARLLTPLWQRVGRMSLKAKLGLCVPALLFLVLFSTTNFLFQQREGLDVITPILMTGIPLVLVLFRAETDQALMPIQNLRRNIPRGFLVGMGLATPFLIAFLLYYLVGLSMYPLLRANVLLGTLSSYVLLRNPVASPGGRGTVPRVPGMMIAVGIFLFFVAPAVADDFLRDPFNLNDGLRTDVIAPILSGIATAVVSILVNGVEVARVMIQAAGPVQEGEEAEHKNFIVQVETTDKNGARSTVVSAETGGVFIYAHCEEVGQGRFPSGDDTIGFALLDGEGWVTLNDLGMQGEERCAHIALVEPVPTSGTPPASCSVHVSAGAGGGLIGATVRLALSFEEEWELDFL